MANLAGGEGTGYAANGDALGPRATAGVQVNEISIELLREKLLTFSGASLNEADVVKLLGDLLDSGGGVTLELQDVRIKLIRREGRFSLKKDDSRRPSSMPPHGSSLPPRGR
jgi:hypothetical protein